MGSSKVKSTQGIGRVGLDEEKSKHIIVNGHWLSNDQYLKDPKGCNKMPFTQEYLDECGITVDQVSEEVRPIV